MLYTFVTVFFIAVLSDTLQVRGLLQVYLRQYFSSERNLFRFLQSKDKFGSHTFCTDHINILVMCIDDLFDYRESESGAFTVLSAGSINLVETIPDFAQTVLRECRFRNLLQKQRPYHLLQLFQSEQKNYHC